MTMPSMSNSSAASSGTGDQSQGGNAFHGGSVNFGAGSTAKGVPTWALLILCTIVAAVLLKKPKR